MQGMASDEFVERVRERSDIFSVVSHYVQLTQKSGRYWGCCPFHNEKTASFTVSPDKGLFYCFGCGAGGDVFKFISLIENVNYYEAIKLQAQRLGIDLPTKNFSPEQERRHREEKILFKINDLAQDFYHDCLIKTARGEVGRKYLAARGITQETIETFKLGFAPDEWENLFNRLTRQDFTAQQLEAVGLIAKRKNSSGYYDRFRARVMIPIADVLGRVVGFGGRIVNSADDTPKYLNTPETVLFNKRNLLFGLDKSGRAISAAGKVIVVEGYMDAISLFSAGVKNVVATLGTAFTSEHVKLILRYAKKIIFCYDSDEAGQRATIRALPIVQPTGAEVFVIKVPDGKDPDEFIRKHGKAAFDNLIEHATTMIDYRMKYILDSADLSTIHGKVQALQDILPAVVTIKDTVTRNEYRKKIAAALIMDEQLVADEWKNFSRKDQQKSAREFEKNSNAVKRPRLSNDENITIRDACETVLRMAWHESDILDYVLALVPLEFFSPVNQEIIGWLKNRAEQGLRADEVAATTELSEPAQAQLSRILIGGTNDPRDTELNIFNDSINTLRRAIIKKDYDKLVAQIKEYNRSGDDEAYKQMIRKSLELKYQMDKLKGS